jgi:hypothetical protein
MLLSELSADAIALVLSYVDARNICRLRECGSGLLTAKMVQTVKSVRMVASVLQKFPFSLFSWPLISSVQIEPDEYMSYYPLALNHQLPLPLVPVPTLEKLELSFAQSFAILALKDGKPILETIFPNLKFLKLSNSTKLLTVENMKALPRNLEKLSISSMFSSATRKSLSCTALEDLPPNLKELSISGSYIGPDPTTKTYNSIKWPVGLVSLRLSVSASQMIFHLPQTLEYLSMDMGDTNDTAGGEFGIISTSLLPASLTSCRIDGFRYNDRHGFKSETYPPQLTRLATPIVFHSMAEELALLPKSLTDVRLPAAAFQVANIPELLPNLQHVNLVGSSPESYLKNLPPNLRDLYNQKRGSCSLSEIPSLPSRLVNLGINISPEEADLRKIPHSVLNLSLSVTGVLSPSLVELLPPRLTSLSTKLHHYESKEAFSRIPKEIVSLELSINHPCPADLHSDPTLLDHLPPNLNALNLTIGTQGTQFGEWIKSLSKYPNLTMLFLFVDDNILNDEPWSMDYMRHIPASVVHLYAPWGSSSLEPEMMAHLSPSLRTLHFSSSSQSQPVASDQCFANLPKNLTALTLPPKLNGISPDIVHVIPETLLELNLPDTSLHSIYYSRSVWEGYSFFTNKPSYW